MKDNLKNSDSTDLLLDAMCNIFGVVLLTAIIIGGISISHTITSPGEVSSKVMQQAQNESALLTSQLNAARSQREFLQNLQSRNSVSEQVAAVDKTLEKRRRQLALEVNKYADKIEDISRSIAAEQALQYKLKNSSIQQEKLVIEQLKNAMTQTRRAPNVSYGLAPAKNLMPYRVIIDPEKFYIIGTNQDIYQPDTENSGVKINTFKHGRTRFFQISKIPEKGIPLSEFAPGKLFDKAACFAELAVESNAIAAAAGIIAELRKNNIAFIWQTITENGLTLRTAERGNYVVSY